MRSWTGAECKLFERAAAEAASAAVSGSCCHDGAYGRPHLDFEGLCAQERKTRVLCGAGARARRPLKLFTIDGGFCRPMERGPSWPVLWPSRPSGEGLGFWSGGLNPGWFCQV